ncbi:MAG: LamG-like jellyroll fold domain-containing protein [Henriciella sp.]
MRQHLVGLLALSSLAIAPIPASAQDAELAWQPDFLELDGSNGLTLIADPEFSIVGGGTIEFWVQPDWTETPDFDPVVLSATGQEGSAYLISLLRGRDGIGIVSGDDELVWSFDFTDGQVHHVAFNFYAEEIALIVDGEVIGVDEFTPADTLPSAIWVGSANGEIGSFTGAIAALRIWGIPVEPEVIDEFRYKDVLSEAQGNHPDIDYLQVVSDFEDLDVLVIEGDVEEEEAQ